MRQVHEFHIVPPSPWPFFTAISLYTVTTQLCSAIHFYAGGWDYMTEALIALVLSVSFWLYDVVKETTYQGHYRHPVKKNVRLGVILFIVSEVMFFFGFFWAYFHSALAPSFAIGCVWPPYGLIVLNPLGIPLLNTALLLTSGATITLAHKTLMINRIVHTAEALIVTLVLALMFTALQFYEYSIAPFGISDGIFGSCFYMLTGLHGLHVIIGTVFIFVAYIRHIKGHLTPNSHFGFESAAWYWHFVDVVWLILYLSVYLWGSWRGIY